jgi:hypothetical protein
MRWDGPQPPQTEEYASHDPGKPSQPYQTTISKLSKRVTAVLSFKRGPAPAKPLPRHLGAMASSSMEGPALGKAPHDHSVPTRIKMFDKCTGRRGRLSVYPMLPLLLGGLVEPHPRLYLEPHDGNRNSLQHLAWLRLPERSYKNQSAFASAGSRFHLFSPDRLGFKTQIAPLFG